MISLILSIIGCSSMSLLLKVAEKDEKSNYGLMCVNYLVATVFAYIKVPDKKIMLEMQIEVLLISIVTGIIYLAVLSLCKHNIKLNGAILATTFMQLGVLVPVFLAIVLWKEKMSVLQSLGSALAIFSIFLISYQREEKQKTHTLLLIGLLILAGISDSMPKFFSLWFEEAWAGWFMCMTFCVAFLISLLNIIIKKEKITIHQCFWGIFLGIANFGGAWFLLKAVTELPAFLVYPMYSVISIMLVSVAGLKLFNEKIYRVQWIGIILVGISIVFLNI